jgi:hypothetical protein
MSCELCGGGDEWIKSTARAGELGPARMILTPSNVSLMRRPSALDR